MWKWIGGAAVALATLVAGAGWYLWNYGTTKIDGLDGPIGGKGNRTEELSQLDLGADIPDLQGFTMRARYIVVPPGGIIRIHSHFGRPAFSYMVNTPVVQHRSDLDVPISHHQGDLSRDVNMAHWWKNESNQTAIWYVADIFPSNGNKGE